MTWRFLVHDIWTSLKQMYDDADITLVHTSYWVSVAANRLLMQHIEKRDSGAFVSIYNDLQVQVEASTGYKYIELPYSIFDFNIDDGVEFLSYEADMSECAPPFTSVTFTRTSPGATRRLYFTEDEEPAPDNPYFYRIKNKLYLLGLENISSPKIEGGFYQTIPPYPLDLDEDFPFPDELLSVLQRYVFDFGRFVLQMPKDNVNDGAGLDNVQQQPKMSPVRSDVTQEEQ